MALKFTRLQWSIATTNTLNVILQNLESYVESNLTYMFVRAFT